MTAGEQLFLKDLAPNVDFQNWHSERSYR